MYGGVGGEWGQGAGGEGFGDEFVGQAGVGGGEGAVGIYQGEVVGGFAGVGGFGRCRGEEDAVARHQEFAQAAGVGDVRQMLAAVNIHQGGEAVEAADETAFDQRGELQG